jgi:hypothetical protein
MGKYFHVTRNSIETRTGESLTLDTAKTVLLELHNAVEKLERRLTMRDTDGACKHRNRGLSNNGWHCLDCKEPTAPPRRIR